MNTSEQKIQKMLRINHNTYVCVGVDITPEEEMRIRRRQLEAGATLHKPIIRGAAASCKKNISV